MICHVCVGSGSILTTKRGYEWWNCPCCGGPAVIKTRKGK